MDWISFSYFQACFQNKVCVQRLTAMTQLTKTYINCSNRFTNTNDHQWYFVFRTAFVPYPLLR